MNVLVTGANGQLGNEMRLVSKRGDDRHVFTDVVAPDGLPTTILDITDIDAIRAIVNAENIDVIVNCAAYTNVDKAEDDKELCELLNAKAVDNWQLNPQNVKAKYVKKSVFVGGLRKFMSNWYGYVVVVVIPLCIVFALIISSVVRDKLALEKEKEKEEGKITLSDISEEDKKKLLENYINVDKTDSDDESKEV